jgi:undecaprenyl-diphosphatase
MEFLYLLEKIRVPVLNEFMLLITEFGGETTFLVMALIIFWCVNKRGGYYVMIVGFFGTILNQFLKLACRVPRPWVLDQNFTILEQAREEATGYSFPSGHSQNAVGTFGSLACITKNRWVKWVSIAIAVLVPLSRMYVGVHTPADVLVGGGMALALVLLLKPVSLKDDLKLMKLLVIAMMTLAIGLLLYVEFWTFPADIDIHNLDSGMKNAYTMIGCIAGIGLVYPIEKKYVNFDTKAVWWAQILKAVLGLVLVLAVKEGLKSPLEALFGASGVYTARAVRYFLIVVVAGAVWPMSFRWFAKLGAKK